MAARRPFRRLSVLLAVVVTAAVLPVVLSTPAGAAPAPDSGLFTPLPGFTARDTDRARVLPRESAAYRIDLTGLAARLALAPSERAVRRGADALELAIPDPTGELAAFRVQQSSVMQGRLAARHPEIRTYAGVGVSDPTATIRLDLTPMGFHASVLSPRGARSWYVDPAFNRRGTTTHLSYLRSALPAPERPLIEPDLDALTDAVAPAAAGEAPGELVQRRTYRLAFVTDPSYATYFGTGNVLAEKTTLINRVNQVYNDDLAIRMVLVNGTDELNLDTQARATGPNGPCGANGCYDPADLDASSGGCTGALLTRNTFVIGQIIGADNYDVGHIGLGINGGGVAGLGVVGESGKARGCTGLPQPEGDFYAVDYVAHEIGHQYAGNHTFNGTLVNCSLTNRNGGTSVEPGSGSSVMAYAGICGRDNLQPHSDPYFSQRSIDEITAHVTADPFAWDEQQVVNLQGYDTSGETFQLTYPGATPVTITRGAGGNYNILGITQAVQQLTGEVAEVSGYDGEASPGTAGFTLDFSTVSTGIDLDTFGVSGGSAGVTGFVGTTVNGGDGTNQGLADVTANHAPGVAAPADKTIPVRTPFTLTAAGTDSDSDSLIYLWEQNDSGPVAPNGGTALLSNTKTNGPLFRVFGTAAQVTDEGTLQSPSPGINLADGSPSRTFPDLAQVLAGNTNAATGACPAPPAAPPAGRRSVPQAIVDCYSEFLPTADYGSGLGGELTFRVTARDRVAAGGGTALDDVVLTLDDTAGPFLVTSRASAGTPAEGGAPETVTWAVNGTDDAALAPMVKISLSTDGGATFPTVLAPSTANDGSETVTLPQVGTDRARIRIEAVGNYFFAVNGADFTISSPLSLTEVEDQTLQYSDDFASPVTLTATSEDVDGDQLVASVAGVEGLAVAPGTASADGVRPGTRVFTVAGPVTESPGAHEAVVTVTEDVADGLTSEGSFAVTVNPEDASVAWTGPTEATTNDATATVPLETSVTDADDADRGDITDATVTFVDRETDEVLCSAPVTGGPLTGTAGCDAELARSGNETTYTIGTVVGGSYLRDSAGDDTEVTVSAADPDNTPPDTQITRGPKQNSFFLGRKATIRYTGSDDTASFRCSLDGKRVSCGEGRVALKKLSNRTHVFRVAARDEAGNLDPTPAKRTFVSPYDDSQLDRKGDWDRKRSANAYRGTWLRSTDRGATLTRNLQDVRRIALVVGTGPGFGRVRVWFRGRLVDTVSLRSDQQRGKVLVPVARFGSKKSGLLRIEAVGGGPVRIEGLACSAVGQASGRGWHDGHQYVARSRPAGPGHRDPDRRAAPSAGALVASVDPHPLALAQVAGGRLHGAFLVEVEHLAGPAHAAGAGRAPGRSASAGGCRS